MGLLRGNVMDFVVILSQPKTDYTKMNRRGKTKQNKTKQRQLMNIIFHACNYIWLCILIIVRVINEKVNYLTLIFLLATVLVS